MHAARLRLADARLSCDLGDEAPASCGILGQMLLLRLPPALHVLPDAPGTEGDGDDGEEIDTDLAPERNVPEGGSDGQGLGRRDGHGQADGGKRGFGSRYLLPKRGGPGAERNSYSGWNRRKRLRFAAARIPETRKASHVSRERQGFSVWSRNPSGCRFTALPVSAGMIKDCTRGETVSGDRFEVREMPSGAAVFLILQIVSVDVFCPRKLLVPCALEASGGTDESPMTEHPA